MNRRNFFKGLLAAATATVTRAYAPAAAATLSLRGVPIVLEDPLLPVFLPGMTLADAAKLTDPFEQDSVVVMLNQSNPLLMDLCWKEGPLIHRYASSLGVSDLVNYDWLDD